MLKNKQTRRNQKGFTFVELVIIAPIVILAIGAFVAVVVNMTAEVLSSRGSNVLAYNVQDALNKIEQDVKLSSTFLAQTSDGLITSDTNQGYDDGTEQFYNVDLPSNAKGNALILNALATTGNPVANTSQVAFKPNSPNPCGDEQAKNTPLTYNIVYYVKEVNGVSSLYRRTVMPFNYTTMSCSAIGTTPATVAPWQRASCTTGGTSTSHCRTYDERLVDGVGPNDFVLSYFTAGNSTIANTSATTSTDQTTRQNALSSATTVSAAINASQTIANKQIQQSASMRVTRLDANASTVAAAITVSAPSTPVVTGVYTSPESATNPNSATFSWPASTGNGTITYTAQYQIDGGAWTNALTNSTTRTFTVSPGHNHTVNARVTATNSAATSSYGTASMTTPLMSPLILKNTWTDYEGVWGGATYTKTDAGLVIVQGLIKRNGGNNVFNEVVGQLPPGYRPSQNYLFQSISNSQNARLDVWADGTIHIVASNINDLTLTPIAFYPAGTSFTNVSTLNGWTTYSDSFWALPASYYQDTVGRVEIRAMIAGGTTADGTPIWSLPSALASRDYLHLPAQANTGNSTVAVSQAANSRVEAKGGGNGWYSIHSLYFTQSRVTGANCLTQWCSLGTLQNGWVAYGSPYGVPEYTKSSDGVVHLKGLIRSGSANTLIQQLPAGYRPKARQLFQVQAAGALGRIDVDATGIITHQVGSNGWVSLDGIKFIAEQ